MEFTQAEKERINELYGNDFQGITPDDAVLIGRWESWKAVNEDEHKAKIEAIKAESDLKLEQSKTEFQQAIDNLRELHDRAVERLENLSNGQ